MHIDDVFILLTVLMMYLSSNGFICCCLLLFYDLYLSAPTSLFHPFHTDCSLIFFVFVVLLIAKVVNPLGRVLFDSRSPFLSVPLH
jgi:hypothetical protein